MGPVLTRVVKSIGRAEVHGGGGGRLAEMERGATNLHVAQDPVDRIPPLMREFEGLPAERLRLPEFGAHESHSDQSPQHLEKTGRIA